MNIAIVICLTLSFAVSNLPGGDGGCFQSEVPKDFRYPESQETVQINRPMKSKSLAGRVLDPQGRGMEKALVERLSAGWKHRKSATFTDSEGYFAFPRQPSGVYCLRLSMRGFNTLAVRVAVTRRSQSDLRLVLGVSN